MGGDFVRRWLSLIAVTLGLAVGLVAITPPGDASALACTSSISPSCQPANLPILIEAGVVTAPNIAGSVGTSTVAVVAKGSSGSIWGGLKTALQGWLGVSTAIDMFGSEQIVDGGLSTDGVLGLTIESDSSLSSKTSFAVGSTSTYTYPSGVVATATLVGFSTSGSGCLVATFSDGSLELLNTKVEGSSGGVYGSGNLTPTNTPPAGCPSKPANSVVGVLSVGPPAYTAWAIAASGKAHQNWAADVVTTPGPVTGVATVTLQCQSLATGVIRLVTSALTQTFVAGQSMTVPDTLCLPEEVAVGVDVDWLKSGTTVPERVIDSEDTQVLPSQKELQTLYPGCFGPGVTGCVMMLEKISGASCGLIGELCEDWASDPNRSSVYQCRYGQTVITLNHCSAYRMPSAGVLPNVDQNGDLLDPSAPVPGIQTPRQPGTAPGTSPNPVPGDNNADCRPASWWEVLTPWWAFKAIGCALQVAFVPSPAKVAQAREAIKDKFDMSPPGKVGIAVSTALIGLEFPTGCEGVTVSLDWMKRGAFASAPFPESFKMLNACPGEPLHPWAVFSSLIISGALIFAGFKTLPALIGKIFTYTGIDG